MKQKRRDFLKKAAGGAGALALAGTTACSTTEPTLTSTDPYADLSSMVTNIKPITIDERRQRIAKAQRLMGEEGIDAIYVEGGSSMFYFTGIRWGNSERMMAAVIPKNGDVIYVCPAFEEDRLRELILFGDEVRVWEEHESPYAVVAGIFADKGIRTGTVGMEERVRQLRAVRSRRRALARRAP